MATMLDVRAEPEPAPSGPRDGRVRMMLKRHGPDVAEKAVTLLISQYCSAEPALVGEASVTHLRFRLVRTGDLAGWSNFLEEALSCAEAVTLAGRLDSHRNRRRQSRARFADVLATELAS